MKAGHITTTQLEEALAQQRRVRVPLGKALITLGYIDENTMRDALCTQLHVNFFDVDNIVIDQKLASLISERFATRHLVVPLFCIGKLLVVAMDDPSQAALIENLETHLGLQIEVVTTTTAKLMAAIKRLYGPPQTQDVNPWARRNILVGPVRDFVVRSLPPAHCTASSPSRSDPAGGQGHGDGRPWPGVESCSMSRLIALVALLLVVLGDRLPVAAADVDYPLVGASGVYTLVNLHPDEQRHRLYSVNYQQPGLIPLCSKVKIESVDKSKMKFRLLDGDREYEYIFHNSLRDPIPKHLDRFFGTKCEPRLETLSEVDRKGIRAGTALTGMTKRGVILAIGYPPEHATPSLDGDVWTYWKNRFGKMHVHFSDGKVVGIRD